LEDVETKYKTLASQHEEIKEEIRVNKESFVVMDEQYKVRIVLKRVETCLEL
jgi:hypothetical protein